MLLFSLYSVIFYIFSILSATVLQHSIFEASEGPVSQSSSIRILNFSTSLKNA